MIHDVDFDDIAIDPDFGATSLYGTDYFGLSWGNFWVTSPKAYHDVESRVPGIRHGVTSGHQVAFTGYEGITAIWDHDGTFDFISANITAMRSREVTISITGLLQGEVLYQTTVAVNRHSPTAVLLNFTGIDEIDFYWIDQKGHRDYGRFVFDDVVIANVEQETGVDHVRSTLSDTAFAHHREPVVPDCLFSSGHAGGLHPAIALALA